MNGLDWFLIAVGLFCLIRGTLRGAISQLFGMAGVLGGLFLAAHSYEALARQLSALFPGLPGTPAVSFVLVLLLTWFCVGITGYWTGKVLRRTGLGFLDRFLGGMVGLAKALLLAIMIVALLMLLLSPKSSFLTSSALTPYVQQSAQILLKYTPKSLQRLFEEKLKTFKNHWGDLKDERVRLTLPSEGKATEA